MVSSFNANGQFLQKGHSKFQHGLLIHDTGGWSRASASVIMPHRTIPKVTIRGQAPASHLMHGPNHGPSAFIARCWHPIFGGSWRRFLRVMA